MNDPSGKNRELLEEISALKKRIQKLERSEAEGKSAERALHESENKYRLLLESILDGVYVIDSNGHFTFVNDVITQRSGHPREWFIGRHYLDVIRPEHREQARRHFDAALRGVASPLHELMLAYERPAGEGLWVEIITNVIWENGRVAGILGVSRDITKRKQAEQALRLSERRYRDLLENIKDGVCITGPDNRFTFVNDIVVERSGYPREWFQGKTILDLIKPELRELVQTLGHRSLRGEKVPPFEVSYVSASGDERWMECHSAPLYEDEEFAGFLTVNRDITERKRIEEELKQHRRRLVEIQETERRHIARELHDEMGQILTAMRISLKRAGSSGTAETALRGIHESLEMVEGLIKQVRNLSIDLHPSILDDLGLTAALDWYITWLAPKAGFRTEFRTEFKEERVSPLLELTCFRIAQEALTNAVRHSHAGNVHVELGNRNGELHLTVGDDGNGFNIDRTRRRALKGGSFGLLGMEERASLAGGHLEIKSEPGKGTVVHAHFPLEPKAR